MAYSQESDGLSPKQRYLMRHEALKSERSTWDSHWRELSDFIQPRRSRFIGSTPGNQGGKKNDSIINGTATWAARTLSSGMMSGITSPARPWFRLTTPDPELSEFGAVKDWLYVVEERIRLAFMRSNIYNSLHVVYQDLAWAGTACMHVEDDFESVLRSLVFPVGQYSLACDARGVVNAVFREYGMTVAQLVKEFGLEACSDMVQSQFRSNQLDQWVEVVHVMEPNGQREPGKIGPKGKRTNSCWFEKSGDEHKVLRESGYDEFPCMAPRWAVTGEDVYGSGPSMDALGDVRALQTLERRGAQAFDKIVNPPMSAPSDMLALGEVSLMPGAIIPVSGNNPAMRFQPALDIRPEAITVVENKIRQHEMRIKTAFFADIWLMFAQADGPQMTATEVAKRQEEKMLQLGPVLERVQDELLDPLIRRTFSILWRNHYLPDPPPELSGGLRVEYISPMAQAQKLLGSGAIERVFSFVGNMAGVNPDILDMVDMDQAVQEYSNMYGVPPRVVRTDKQVAAIRKARAQAKQAAAQQEQAMAAAQSAKLLSETDMSGDSALTRAVNTLGPQAAAGTGLTQ